MPNWCENDLRIEGPKVAIDSFLAAIKKSDGDEDLFDFNAIIPYPQKFRDLDKAAMEWDEKHSGKKNIDWSKRPQDGFNQGGYDWCIANWGTKWGACDTSIERMDDEEVELHFNTAWSPPMPIILAASQQYPNLVFTMRYFEGGCAFNGLYVAARGKVETDKTGEYFGDRGG